MLLVCLVLRMMQFLGVIGISVRLTCSVDRLKLSTPCTRCDVLEVFRGGLWIDGYCGYLLWVYFYVVDLVVCMICGCKFSVRSVVVVAWCLWTFNALVLLVRMRGGHSVTLLAYRVGVKVSVATSRDGLIVSTLFNVLLIDTWQAFMDAELPVFAYVFWGYFNMCDLLQPVELLIRVFISLRLKVGSEVFGYLFYAQDVMPVMWVVSCEFSLRALNFIGLVTSSLLLGDVLLPVFPYAVVDAGITTVCGFFVCRLGLLNSGLSVCGGTCDYQLQDLTVRRLGSGLHAGTCYVCYLGMLDLFIFVFAIAIYDYLGIKGIYVCWCTADFVDEIDLLVLLGMIVGAIDTTCDFGIVYDFVACIGLRHFKEKLWTDSGCKLNYCEFLLLMIALFAVCGGWVTPAYETYLLFTFIGFYNFKYEGMCLMGLLCWVTVLFLLYAVYGGYLWVWYFRVLLFVGDLWYILGRWVSVV
eukprot:gene13147-8993_t